MPAIQNTQWNVAAAATAVAGIGLVLLQPMWWEGALYMMFQCCIVLWLHPKPAPSVVADTSDMLMEEIRGLHIQLDQRRELLGRVLPLWDEQIQQALDQLSMPGMQITTGSAAKDRINLIIDAVRADMQRFGEIVNLEKDNRIQPHNWLSIFAAIDTELRDLEPSASIMNKHIGAEKIGSSIA